MKKQILKNVSINFVSLIFSIITGLILTPFLVKNLGITVYGMLPIALFMTFYVSVISQSITSAVNRFLIEQHIAGMKNETNEIFTTGTIIIFVYSVAIFIIGLYPVYHIDFFLKVPAFYLKDTRELFLFVLASISLSVITSSISVSAYIKNRIDLLQIGNIIRSIAKLLFVFVLFHMGHKELHHVGLAIFLSELLSLIYIIIIWRKITPELILNKMFFRKKNIRKITSFSGWIVFDQLGSVLFLKTDLLVINKLMGSRHSGDYSIATQFSDLLRALAGLVAGSLGPVMMMLYEKKENEKLTALTLSFVKLLSLTLAIPIILLCIFSKEVLFFWLGSDFVHLYKLVWLVTLPLIINLGTLPILSINLAVKKIKLPAVMNFVLAFSGIILSLVLFYNTNLGIYTIAISFGFCLTIKNAFFIPLYAAKIINVSRFTFFKMHMISIIFSMLFACIAYFTKDLFIGSGILFLAKFALLGLTGLVLSFFFYSKKERTVFVDLFTKKRESM